MYPSLVGAGCTVLGRSPPRTSAFPPGRKVGGVLLQLDFTCALLKLLGDFLASVWRSRPGEAGAVCLASGGFPERPGWLKDTGLTGEGRVKDA